ncbi:hypothetical protein IFM89_002085 [Coptis chinensis]|uniref:DUF4218 domain-containing protein n=1 Tax=Coptis chinensis TaxID=261450 RepID=A0A835LE04_9MAGN|nr:hypothetical protein IFM89_002085 [Coptis chinensis]
MLDLVNDALMCARPEGLDACMNELGSDRDTHAELREANHSENNSREVAKAKKLWEDATQPLMMRTFKTYVRNKRFPEGCIAERYLIEESILYCNEYMPKGGSGSHKRARNNFFDEDKGCSSEQLIGKGKVHKLTNLQHEQVRRWVLECSKDATSWREKYHVYQQNHPSKKRGRKGKSVGKVMDFIPWLREQVGIGSRQFEGGNVSRQSEGGNGSEQSKGGNGSGQSETEAVNTTPRQKIFVLFDDDGRPVGDKAAEYSSHLGEYSRAHASITHHRWKDVSDDDKKLIWKRISDEYDLSGITKEKVMDKANEYWRKYKSNTLRKVYDKYRTDEERKRHCPNSVRKEDWENFVDNESTEEAKARRVNGKRSREVAVAQQRSRRKASARIAHELKEKNPNTPVMRTHVYVALHTTSDGTFPTQEHSDKMVRIKEIAANTPSSTMLDMDHDPVAQVMGRDTKGRYRGLGSGVSRKGLEASAPAKN